MTSSHYILVADDDPTMRRVLARLVQRVLPSATIVEAASGQAALAALQIHAFSLVITDYHMPGASGLDVVTTIRARSATLPIIVVSAYPAVEPVVLAAGANAFIAKPFALDHLASVLRALVLTP